MISTLLFHFNLFACPGRYGHWKEQANKINPGQHEGTVLVLVLPLAMRPGIRPFPYLGIIVLLYKRRGFCQGLSHNTGVSDGIKATLMFQSQVTLYPSPFSPFPFTNMGRCWIRALLIARSRKVPASSRCEGRLLKDYRDSREGFQDRK